MKNNTKKIKPELIIIEDETTSPKNITLKLDKAIDNLLIAYPHLPNSIGDLSPGDF
jgi:hypothetical protein